MRKHVLSTYSSAKNYKNQTSFSRVMITNALPRFLRIKEYLKYTAKYSTYI